MQKSAKVSLFVVACLLILNGLLNIVDDGTVRTYDIASILSGIGYVIVIYSLRNR